MGFRIFSGHPFFGVPDHAVDALTIAIEFAPRSIRTGKQFLPRTISTGVNRQVVQTAACL
jgi:hypothetical protein